MRQPAYDSRELLHDPLPLSARTHITLATVRRIFLNRRHARSHLGHERSGDFSFARPPPKGAAIRRGSYQLLHATRLIPFVTTARRSRYPRRHTAARRCAPPVFTLLLDSHWLQELYLGNHGNTPLNPKLPLAVSTSACQANSRVVWSLAIFFCRTATRANPSFLPPHARMGAFLQALSLACRPLLGRAAAGAALIHNVRMFCAHGALPSLLHLPHPFFLLVASVGLRQPRFTRETPPGKER